MSVNVTGVGWTDLTANLWSGCHKISPECKFCYSETLTEQRRGLPAAPYGFELTVRPKNLRDFAAALRRFGPSLIFCESMSDIGLDDDELTVAEIDRLYTAGYDSMDHLRDDFFMAVRETPQHRDQLQT
jgi:protein gp37